MKVGSVLGSYNHLRLFCNIWLLDNISSHWNRWPKNTQDTSCKENSLLDMMNQVRQKMTVQHSRCFCQHGDPASRRSSEPYSKFIAFTVQSCIFTSHPSPLIHMYPVCHLLWNVISILVISRWNIGYIVLSLEIPSFHLSNEKRGPYFRPLDTISSFPTWLFSVS